MNVKLALLLMLLLMIFGCTQEADEPQSPEQNRSVPVEVTKVESGIFHETVQGIGTLRALEEVEVRPEIAGIVKAIHFEESSMVKKGTLLFALDDAKLQNRLEVDQAALQGAQARLQNALRTYRRNKALVDDNLVSEEKFDQIRTDLEAARAEVERLKAEIRLVKERIEDTEIRAPFTGVISESLVDPGDFVEVGDTLTTMYRVSALEIDFWVAERHMGRLKQGQPVEVEVTAYPGRRFQGQVTFVSPAVRERTRDFLVKANIADPQRLLKPGAFGRAVVIVDVLRDRPTIPEEALIGVREGYIVFIVEDGTARQREIRAGLRVPGRVEVLSGVEIGETVVRAGHMQLSDGDPVRVVDGNKDTIEDEASQRKSDHPVSRRSADESKRTK